MVSKTARRFFIFLGWLALILVTAPFTGMLYDKIQYEAPATFLASSDILTYIVGILISYISVTILFCFIFIKKLSHKYIWSLVLTLPMLLWDMSAGDGPKLLLDIANIVIFLIIGHMIYRFWHKK